MYEVRAPVTGIVLDVVVDEGQLIAEDEPIAIVESEGQQVVVATEVPGVVREIDVERGQGLSTGDVVARIDES